MSGSVVRVHRVLLVAGVLVVAAGTGWALKNASEGNFTAISDRQQPDVSRTHTLAGSHGSTSRAAPGASSPPTRSTIMIAGGKVSARGQRGKFSVTIRQPAAPPRVDLGILDAAGRPITAACSTCHAARPANFANRTPADLDEFHQSLSFAHGAVTCLSCHNPGDYDTLRLADGRSVEYRDVMTLCAQCHGPKTRDYQHGAHGGMIGYWDLSRGPRTRNNCIDCHDAHVPSFPAMKPTFKPRDRFLSGAVDAEKGHLRGSHHE